MFKFGIIPRPVEYVDHIIAMVTMYTNAPLLHKQYSIQEISTIHSKNPSP